MQNALHLLSATLPMFYALVAIDYAVYFGRHDPFAERTCTRALATTAVVHLAYFVLKAIDLGHHPIVSLSAVASMVALAVATVYLYVERIQRTKFTGAFVVPMVVLLTLFSAAAMPSEAPSETLSELARSPIFGLHTAFAVLGYTAFAVGALYGVMFVLLYRALKRKRFGLIFERLPSLDELANMGFWATFLGWILLGVTIALGVIMGMRFAPGFYKDVKFISTLLVWGAYGLAVLARFGMRWRGARVVYLSLGAFLFALCAVAGSALSTTFHSFQS